MVNNNSTFSIGDLVIVYNCIEHQKEGGLDLPEGNDKYYQKAIIINVRKDKKYGDWLADVKFESGLVSNGHFQRGIKSYT